jgi:hypothetical protein
MDVAKIAALRAAGASGDWLELQGGKGMELLGSVCVPSPGMRGIARKAAPIRRMRSDATEQSFSDLVADLGLQAATEHVAIAACSCSEEGNQMSADTTEVLFNAAGEPVTPMGAMDMTRMMLATQSAIKTLASSMDSTVGAIRGLVEEQGTKLASLMPKPQILASVYEAVVMESTLQYGEILTDGTANWFYQLSYDDVGGATWHVVRSIAPDGTIAEEDDAIIAPGDGFTRTGMKAEYKAETVAEDVPDVIVPDDDPAEPADQILASSAESRFIDLVLADLAV